jgi:hypothetical protein
MLLVNCHHERANAKETHVDQAADHNANETYESSHMQAGYRYGWFIFSSRSIDSYSSSGLTGFEM